MPTPAFDRLGRVLDLEEKQGWRNRGVIGGISAMGERWADDARAEILAAEQEGEVTDGNRLVDVVLDLMDQYDAGTPETRPEIVATIRGLLDGDIPLPEPASELEEAAQEKSAGRDDAVASTDVSNRSVGRSGGDDAGKDDIDNEDDIEFQQAIEPAEATNVARERTRRKQARNPNATSHDLQASPSLLSGVGPARVEQLARLGINTVADLMWHLPARYEDYSKLRTISALKPGEEVTIVANLWEIRERKISRGRQMIQGILADGTGTLHATWWNKWIVKKLTIGETMRFSGKVGLYLGQLTLDNPVFEDVDTEMVATGRLTSIYPLTEGISNNWLRDQIRQVLSDYTGFLSDPLPAAIRADYDLPDLATALTQAHFPDDLDSLQAALNRLAFEELFYLQLGVLQRRSQLKDATASSLVDDGAIVERFRGALSFQMTGAQARVLDEILADMARSVPMTRLVQGDVGSGKTAVAAAAMFVAMANGVQSAMLAPTQILAEQHYRSLCRTMDELTKPDGTPINVALLTGRVVGAEREAVLEGLRSGATDIVVGTTALIQETVEFANLGFFTVDEQHRFGVEQRGALRNKAENQPHLLVMSATPIPRSLALTVYGDLDLSIIDEMPPGRIPIQTKLFRPSERERLYRFLRREAAEGRQAFIVYPLVEESEKLDVGSAVEAYERLSAEILPTLRLGLLHGRMSGSEKDEVMRAFAAKDYDVLVSTSVIEVGIDIPNASLIIIEDAERFGLAQLHQFRGRVGRGSHKSYCALVSGADGGESEERLLALQESDDGFVLAEKDLELRGPGDFLGTRQSGLPMMRIASLGDMETLLRAREAGQKLFAEDPSLEQFPQVRRQVERFWRGQGDIS